MSDIFEEKRRQVIQELRRTQEEGNASYRAYTSILQSQMEQARASGDTVGFQAAFEKSQLEFQRHNEWLARQEKMASERLAQFGGFAGRKMKRL